MKVAETGAVSLFLLLLLSGCGSKTVPSEVVPAQAQEHDLWRAGAPVYAPLEYETYRANLREATELLIREKARLAWFRNYEPAAGRFKALIAEGEGLLVEINRRKEAKEAGASALIVHISGRLKTLRRLTGLINEGRLSRTHITRAEVLVGEAGKLVSEGRLAEAETRLEAASSQAEQALELMLPILSRYSDGNLIDRWKRWAAETLRESESTGGYAMIVNKLDRSLTLYKGGKPQRTYSVGIGFNGSKDKLHAGDNATPEGRYRVARKIPKSRYYKALLIDYPNDEDRRQFAAAKKKGLIPAGAGIGGLIEIHGGGREGMTYGCVALENKEMESLYGIVEVGVPVTIVGAMSMENDITREFGPMGSVERGGAGL